MEAPALVVAEVDTDPAIFREYEPWELGRGGYPVAWRKGLCWGVEDDGTTPKLFASEHLAGGGIGVKDVVRQLTGFRCQRCGHPYQPGCGEWTTSRRGTRASAYIPEHRPEGPGTYTDALFWDGVEDELGVWAGDLIRESKVLWSPCDERCTHGAPWRFRMQWEGGISRPWTHWTSDHLPDNARHVQAAWRVLTVHHLNGREHDLRWWNIVALCQRCHLIIQRKVAMEQVYPFEHTEWFKPHAAGWYAYAYLGESLTRHQVAARQDELLALERLA